MAKQIKNDGATIEFLDAENRMKDKEIRQVYLMEKELRSLIER